MEWYVGDGLRVLHNTEIEYGEELANGMLYEVIRVDKKGLPQVGTEASVYFEFTESEMQYVKRIPNAFDKYEMSDAELGEPSESPNVTLSEIYEEICDMKAMIGRLIRNGEES